MNWYEKATNYINNHLDEFAQHFFGDSKVSRYSTGIQINPSPCCSHNDCFSLVKKGGNNGGFNCFSCGEKGTRIQAVQLIFGKEAGISAIEEWTGIKYEGPNYSKEEALEKDKARRIAKIQEEAIEFYRTNLLQNKLAHLTQLSKAQDKGHRGHSPESIEKYRVGLSGNYPEFTREMKDKGYDEEEIKEAGKLVWVPEGYYVYPYYDLKGNLVRINAKLFVKKCFGKKDNDGFSSNDCDFQLSISGTTDLLAASHERDTGHTMAKKGYSRGERVNVFYYARNGIKGKRKAILVEGENDVISCDEELSLLPKSYQKEFVVIGLGGNPDEETFDSPFFRQFDAIFEAFDNDDAGEGYRKALNERVPDVPVYSMRYDTEFSDIDNYIKSEAYQQDFKDLIDKATFVDSKGYVIERDGNSHDWTLRNRKFHIQFAIETYNKKSNQLEVTMSVEKNGQKVDRKTGPIDNLKVDGSILYAKLEFSQYLDEYYNEIPWEGGKPARPLWELIDIFKHTKNFHQVTKQIAWHLHKSDKEEYKKIIQKLQRKMNQKNVAEILREVNGFENQEIDLNGIFPKMSLSQFFHTTNNDAYFYFSRLVQDGDVPRLVPCLISNKKEEIRLDLLKKKDEQCLLLIENKYELPAEVGVAVMDPIEVSLQPYWVNKWKNDELDKDSYNPHNLIIEIEEFIGRSYYLEKSALKVLSLWIYSTYFYMLFKSGFPYLLFTGAKGTGKSTIDTLIYLLALNPKFALDFSEAALYRTINNEGGTFILDEIENLTEKKNVDASGYAKILKGGYADLGYIYRTNMENKGLSERFSVFGPKVISNINGIEDVIGDRCIFIQTFAAPDEKLEKLVDIQVFKQERRSEAHSISSRCVISALEYFQDVNTLFYDLDSRLATGNARLSQLIRPLMTMARFVGGDYEEHLLRFYDKKIKGLKQEISNATIEGTLKNVLKHVSEELIGFEKTKWATDTSKHLYDTPIKYDSNTGLFEIDTLHMKVLCEEMNDNETLDLKTINAKIKNILSSDFDVNKHRQRTVATITDESLRKHFGDKRQIKVYRYFLNVNEFVAKEIVQTMMSKNKADDSLF